MPLGRPAGVPQRQHGSPPRADGSLACPCSACPALPCTPPPMPHLGSQDRCKAAPRASQYCPCPCCAGASSPGFSQQVPPPSSSPPCDWGRNCGSEAAPQPPPSHAPCPLCPSAKMRSSGEEARALVPIPILHTHSSYPSPIPIPHSCSPFPKSSCIDQRGHVTRSPTPAEALAPTHPHEALAPSMTAARTHDQRATQSDCHRRPMLPRCANAIARRDGHDGHGGLI